MAPIRHAGVGIPRRIQTISEAKRSSRSKRPARSGLLLVLAAATDDVADIIVALLGLFDEGGIVEASVPLAALPALGSLAFGGRLLGGALRPGTGLLEGAEFGLLRLGSPGGLRHDRSPGGRRLGPRPRRHRLEHRPAFRAV